MNEERTNLYKKIAQVMKDVSYLSKDDAISYKSIKYKAISEEKVTKTVRESLIKNGLIIIPARQERERRGDITSVDVTYKIIDIDSGEYEVICSSGDGYDTQDKGIGKAMTYAYKYMMLRTFAIPTGEDPDKISSAEIDSRQQAQHVQKLENFCETESIDMTKVLNKFKKSKPEQLTKTEIKNIFEHVDSVKKQCGKD